MTRKQPPRPGGPTSSLLPATFADRMRALLDAEAEALFAALAQEPLVGLRVNTLKLSVDEFRVHSPWPLEPIPWCPSGFILPGDAQPGRHPYHAAGLFYVQEPAAMAVAEALAPRPGERLLDLAAAPGGKATHLVALTEDRGLLVANEMEASRVRALLSNTERWGAWHGVITNNDPRRLAERWAGLFDRVLLDAPCSGEGMFRKSQAALDHWSEDNIHGCALRQGQILADAARLVRPGGYLAYSTCTFAPEENEQVMARFLNAHPDFELRPVDLPGVSRGRSDWVSGSAITADLTHTARIWPHLARGEGHFIALLQRGDGPVAQRRTVSVKPIDRRVQAMWAAFAAATFGADPAFGRLLVSQNDALYAIPDDAPALDGLRASRVGVRLGTLRGKIFEPAHSLALAICRADVAGAAALGHVVNLTNHDPRLQRYLQGHPLAAPGVPGWTLVTVDGFALGWGRRSGDTLKNAYPKGLRRPLT